MSQAKSVLNLPTGKESPSTAELLRVKAGFYLADECRGFIMLIDSSHMGPGVGLHKVAFHWLALKKYIGQREC